jgi:hypothetical protein
MGVVIEVCAKHPGGPLELVRGADIYIYIYIYIYIIYQL